MRIIQIINGLSSGGAERFVVDLSNQLSALGHDVMIVVYDNSTDRMNFYAHEVDRNVKIYSLGLVGKLSIKKILTGISRFNKLLHEYKPDIVHGHLGAHLMEAGTYFYKRKIKYVFTIHNLAQVFIKSKSDLYINKWLFKNKIQPITISEKCHQSYMDTYGLENDIRIDNGRSAIVKTEFYDSVNREIENIRGDLTGKVFLCVARCSKEKNQEMMISAFNDLYTEGYNVHLIFTGSGYLETERGKELQKCAGKNIHFLGEKNNISDYLMASDYFTLGSIFEGLPISLLEALSIGKTTICTPAGGIPDVIMDGRTGILAKNFSKEAYKEAIVKALSVNLDKNEIIKTYEDKFSMKICAEKYLRAYMGK